MAQVYLLAHGGPSHAQCGGSYSEWGYDLLLKGIFILILMRLKRLCWHGSPHHPIHFSCVIALFFFFHSLLLMLVKVFRSCGKSTRPLKRNFLFLLLFILSGSLCVGEKTMTQGFCFLFFFSTWSFLVLSAWWTGLCVCVYPEWHESLCKWEKKHNTGPDFTLLLVMTKSLPV